MWMRSLFDHPWFKSPFCKLIVLVVVILLVCSLCIYVVELKDLADDKKNTFLSAVWWTVVTMTTVGYGDHYPVTIEGRLVAAVLMIAGIALIGVVTATVAAWLVQRVSSPSKDESERSIEELKTEVAALTATLQQFMESGVSDPAQDAVDRTNSRRAP